MHAPLFAKSVHVHEIFSLLFGGDTVVRESSAMLAREDQAAIGYYVDSQQAIRHALVCDYALANSAGAALSLVPAAVVLQAVKRKTVDENLADNLREVMNICANLFQSSDEEQARLDHVDLLPQKSSSPKTGMSHLFEVLIPRYPAGKIQLVEIL